MLKETDKKLLYDKRPTSEIQVIGSEMFAGMQLTKCWCLKYIEIEEKRTNHTQYKMNQVFGQEFREGNPRGPINTQKGAQHPQSLGKCTLNSHPLYLTKKIKKKKFDNTRCWQSKTGNGSLHVLSVGMQIQPSWWVIWKYLVILKMPLSHDQIIPISGPCSLNVLTKVRKEPRIGMSVAACLIMVKNWKENTSHRKNG